MSLRLAVVGSGPAGFFLTKSLIRHLPGCRVDIMERLPCPFGLIRYGVAPDHPQIKGVAADFSAVATSPDVRFLGNVSVGSTLPLQELQKHYSGVVYAYGASADRELGIAGEAQHVLSARSFVEWYNTLPGAAAFDLADIRSVALIGNGNVALDVARILAAPISDLRTTDINAKACMVLENSAVKDIHVVGRRGVLQAACAIKELRKLTEVEGVGVRVFERDIQDSQIAGTEEHSYPQIRAKKRLLELLNALPREPNKSARVQIHFHFLQSPVKVTASEIHLQRNSLRFSPSGVQAVGTEEYTQLPCDLVLRSTGYRTVAIDPAVPFDEKMHVIAARDGRAETEFPVYAAGWCRSGPVGILDYTMRNAFVSGISRKPLRLSCKTLRRVACDL